MRLAALLMLAFVCLFSLWTITGIRIFRCAMGITLAEEVVLDDVDGPVQWLLSLANAHRDAGGAYQNGNGGSL